MTENDDLVDKKRQFEDMQKLDENPTLNDEKDTN